MLGGAAAATDNRATRVNALFPFGSKIPTSEYMYYMNYTNGYCVYSTMVRPYVPVLIVSDSKFVSPGEHGCYETVRLHLNDVECDRSDSSRLLSVPVSHHLPPRVSTGELCEQTKF